MSLVRSPGSCYCDIFLLLFLFYFTFQVLLFIIWIERTVATKIIRETLNPLVSLVVVVGTEPSFGRDAKGLILKYFQHACDGYNYARLRITTLLIQSEWFLYTRLLCLWFMVYSVYICSIGKQLYNYSSTC